MHVMSDDSFRSWYKVPLQSASTFRLCVFGCNSSLRVVMATPDVPHWLINMSETSGNGPEVSPRTQWPLQRRSVQTAKDISKHFTYNYWHDKTVKNGHKLFIYITGVKLPQARCNYICRNADLSCSVIRLQLTWKQPRFRPTHCPAAQCLLDEDEQITTQESCHWRTDEHLHSILRISSTGSLITAPPPI